MAKTLANLRLEAQQRCNQENKTLVSTAEWLTYINAAISELYDLVIAVNPHYYVASFAFTISSGNTFDLTTVTGGFYKFRGLDYLPSSTGRAITIHPFNFAERNRQGYRGYAIEGNSLMLMPSTSVSGNYALWYTKPPPALAIDADTLDSILDVWWEYVTVTAAIAGAMKEESSLEGLGAQKQLLIDRINKAAANRDGEPGQAADLMSRNEAEWWY